jgi:dTDP-3-amino-3,4,6-trideoxy-alpha-D-glucose transaminase
MGVRFFDPRRSNAEVGVSVDAAIRRVRRSGVLVLGPEVEAFEREFAGYCSARAAIGVGSGLDALQLVLRADGIGPGDEVVVPAYTAVATWMAVSLVGATPVGADVDADTFNVLPGAVERSVGPRTRAVIGVDLFGQPADWDALSAVAERASALLYADAAQAHGARLRGRPVGSLARATTFSFYPTKNLAALGDGGAVTTDDAALADRLRLLRVYGWRRRGESEVKGLNSRLDELQAAVLRVRLGRLDAWNDRRRAIADRYRDALADAAGGVRVPTPAPGVEHVWHQFVITHRRRDELRRGLAERGVESLVHYDPLPHLTQAYRADGWAEGQLPVAEELARRALSLPMDPHLDDAEVDAVIEAVTGAARELSP